MNADTTRPGLHPGVLLGWILILGACAPGPTEPEWIHLAATEVDEGPDTPERFDEPSPDLHQGLCRILPAGVSDGPGTWTTFRLHATDWRPTAFPNTFAATTLLGPAQGRPADGRSPYRLTEREFGYPDASELPDDDPVAPAFRVAGDRVFLTVEEGQAPSAEMEFSTFFAASGATPEGRRFGSKEATGEGFRIWPGKGTTVQTRLPPGSSLRFATFLRRAGGLAVPTARLFVMLDGEELAELAHVGDDRATVRWHEVPLPPAGRAQARLTFRIEGPPVLLGVLSPIVGPAETGHSGERPWGPARPDLVVYLADTFRADNLTAYGSDEGLTPHLDAFAGEARVFEQSWSTSTWTLPSQASLLSGLHPYQHSAVSPTSRLPDSIVTLAELLRSRGYRTVAVTDALFVSARYGLDQGFEVFLEEHLRPGRVDSRLEDLLAADDGRPLFLYFQTYRAHSPYHATEETQRSLAERWGPLRSHGELVEELTNFAWDKTGDLPPHMAATLEEFRRLYLAGVHDLDARFAEIRRALAAAHHLDEGYLLFTSDHGETFGEHLELFHGNTLYEEEIRVPLLAFGPRFGVGRTVTPASLLDLPRTLAELAGVAPDPAWGGRSLLAQGTPDLVSAYGCFTHDRGEAYAVRQGDQKLMLPAPADARAPRRAYHLGDDPGEQQDLAPTGAPWLAPLEGRARRVQDERLEPAASAVELDLTPEERRELKAMGYG